MNIKECMDFINSYSKSGGRITDLSRAEELMESVGNPEKQLKFIHVAGTNGKGSTVEYISNALIYSGYKTGQFTSPFILHYTDRIRINGREIDEKTLCSMAELVKKVVKDREYSQFEITMAIAMLWFMHEKCDVVVLEAGIGGLLDCTNIIESPLLSVITSVSFDHTAILGNNLEDIAFQKAGIIKKNSTVILSMDNFSVTKKIVQDKAVQNNSEFINPDHSDFQCNVMEMNGMHFVYKGENFKTAMLGFHQPVNAVTAIEACRYLRKFFCRITEETIRKAVESSQVKARVQYVAGNPPVIVDGGHNVSGVAALSAVLESIRIKGVKIFAVLGMIDSKDYKSAAEKIAEKTDKIFCVEGFAYNSVKAEILSKIVGEKAEKSCSLQEAAEKAKKLAVENNGIVVICGSLYLASEYLNICEKD